MAAEKIMELKALPATLARELVFERTHSFTKSRNVILVKDLVTW
jgi:hypothetical protein